MSWMTAKQAAKALNVSTRSIQRWGKKEELPRMPQRGTDGSAVQYLYWVDQEIVDEKRVVPDPQDLVSQLPDGVERALYIPDPHVPKNDKVATELLFDFARWFKPHKVFVIGDVIDFYSISSYSKTPGYKWSAQDELDAAGAFFQRVIGACPEADITWLMGNHEYRWERYLCNKAPELYSLRALNLRDLVLPFDKEIICVPYNAGTVYRGRKIEHGSITSNKSGYTAHRLLDRRRMSGVSGHTHRYGHVFYNSDRGVEDWMEIGNLEDSAEVGYLKGEVPNWQQAFAVSYWMEELAVPRMQGVPIYTTEGQNKVAFFGNEVFRKGPDEVED